MLELIITGITHNKAIEGQLGHFPDMLEHAIEQRDDARVLDPTEDVLEVHTIEDVVILYSPTFGYAYVNEEGDGIGDSMLIGNGECDSAAHAYYLWTGENV